MPVRVAQRAWLIDGKAGGVEPKTESAAVRVRLEQAMEKMKKQRQMMGETTNDL